MFVFNLFLRVDNRDVISQELVGFHSSAHHDPAKHHGKCSRHLVENFGKDVHEMAGGGLWSGRS